ncbi:MAG: branched-chain amino acid ABC transporter permease [Acidimicrobiia bacterium]
MRKRIALWALIIAAAVVVPLRIQDNRYWLTLGIVGCIYAVFTCGQTLLLGYAGQVSLGHAALYGIGAYTSAILTSRHDWPFPLAFAMAGVLTAVVAYFLGRPMLHLEPFYLAMATLVLGIAANEIFHTWTSVTGGTGGVIGIPSASLGPIELDEPLRYLYFTLAVALIVLALSGTLVRTFVGRAFRAIKSDEAGALAAGVDVRAFKAKVFALSGALAGLAGAMYAHHAQFISPESFGTDLSVLVVIMAVVGGPTRIVGAAIGAIFLVGFPEITRSYGEWRDLMYGAVLFVTLVFAPEGIAGTASAIGRRLRPYAGRRPKPPTAASASTADHKAISRRLETVDP